MRKFTFEITEEAFQLLLSIKTYGSAKYRDPRYSDIDDFRNNKDENYDSNMSDESFLERNHNGTYYLVEELLKYNLIECDMDSWHTTYVLSELGKELTSDVSLRDSIINEILEDESISRKNK